MVKSAMLEPPLAAPLVDAFCQLWSATTRGHGSPDHHPKNGPPDATPSSAPV
jgi:hypothetical protein